jgi:hypothetical protein
MAVPRPRACEESATGYFGSVRCADASDHRPRQVRDIPAIATGHHSRLRFLCAVTRHTGGTRGVDHGPSIGRRCCEGRQRRSRPRVTSRATMSDRPRAWDASGGTHRSIIATPPIASRPPSGRRSRVRAKRTAGPLVRPQARRVPPRKVRSNGDTRGSVRTLATACAAANRETAASGRLHPFPGPVMVIRTGEVLRSRDQDASSVP